MPTMDERCGDYGMALPGKAHPSPKIVMAGDGKETGTRRHVPYLPLGRTTQQPTT